MSNQESDVCEQKSDADDVGVWNEAYDDRNEAVEQTDGGDEREKREEADEGDDVAWVS